LLLLVTQQSIEQVKHAPVVALTCALACALTQAFPVLPAPTTCSVPEVESVYLNMPNLHFLPCAPVTSQFENDIYLATSEPHGNIEAVVTRPSTQPHCRL
jgi:urate oxidase